MKIGLEQKEISTKLGRDIRIEKKIIPGNQCISFAVEERESGNYLFSASLILYYKKDYDLVNFWKLDKNADRLLKLPLRILIMEPAEIVLTFGFTNSPKNFLIKYQVIKNYIKMSQKLISDYPLFAYVETTGIEYLDDYTISQNNLTLSEDARGRFSKNHIGITNPNSRPVEKFSINIGLAEAEGIYNLRTLGKVFIKQLVPEQ